MSSNAREARSRLSVLEGGLGGILGSFKKRSRASQNELVQATNSHCKVNLHGNGLETSVSRELGCLDSKNLVSRPERGAV